MQYARVLLVAAGLLSSALPNAFAGEVKIIANSSVKKDIISAAELQSFSGAEQLARGWFPRRTGCVTETLELLYRMRVLP